MKSNIIGRHEEMATLASCYESNKSELVIVYGRRRIGKTFLIRETFDNKFDFYLTGLYNKSKKKQLENFSYALSEYSGETSETPSSWYEAFRLLKGYISNINHTGKKLIFLDEVPWMDNKRSDFVSALENFWNGWGAGQKDVMLILCGSATAWMMDKILGDKGGLFNRDTERIYLEQFTLKETEEFLHSNGVMLNRYEEAQCYMIMGGVPYYLAKVRRGMSLSQNIDNMFFKKNPLLKDEFNHLYNALFNKSEQYIKIAEMLSREPQGMTRSEIAQKLKLSKGGNLSKMLENMVNSDLIRIDPYYERLKKDAVYQLCDFYTIFYFKFIKDGSNDEKFWSNLAEGAHSAWIGLAFEQLCFAHIRQMKMALGIIGVGSEYYAWRNNMAGGAQIDLIIDRNDHIIDLCEMKFSKQEYFLTKDDVKSLENKRDNFVGLTSTKKAVHPVLVTTYGLKPNKYSTIIQNVIILNDLFE